MANRFKIRRGSVAPNNSADIENYELVYNYTNNELWTKHNGSVVKIASGATGTVTNVVAGNGLTGGGTSTATLDLDFSELTDLTSDISGSTEFILQDGTTESRKAASEIKLSAFNNDLSLSSGTVTSVTAGTGATQSGTNTVNPTINVVGENGLVASANAIGLDISTLSEVGANNLEDEDLFALEVAIGAAIKKIPASDLKTYINSALPASAITSGTLGVARGGTGASTFTSNALLTGNGTSAIQAESTLTYNGSTLTFDGSNNGNRNIELGSGGTGTAFIDLIGDDTYTDYGARLIRWGSGANSTTDLVHRGTGDFRFITSDAANILWLTGGAEKMRMVHSTGNLGIGTNSPGAKLDVGGDADEFAFIGRARVGFNSHSDWASFQHRDSATSTGYALLQNSSGRTILNSASGQELQFRVNNADGTQMVFDGTNLKLKATSKLYFDGGNGTYVHELSDNVIEFRTDNNPQLKIDNSAGVIVNDGSYSSFDFRVESNNNQHMLFVDSGNDRVGIGTSSPTHKLHVTGDVRSTGKFLCANNTGFTEYDAAGNIATLARQDTSDILFIGDSNHTEQIKIQSANSTGNGYIHCQNNGNIGFSGNTSFSSPMVVNYGVTINEGGNDNDTRIESVGNTNMFRVDASANRIGIGDGSPSYTLDVSGDIRATGDLRASDDMVLDVNNNYLYARDASNTLTRVLGINSSNNFYIGPIDNFAGGSMLIGTNSNITNHYLYTQGTFRLRVNQSYVYASNKLLVPDGSASVPTYSFWNDSNTGFYRPSTDMIGFTTAGSARLLLDASGPNFINNTGLYMDYRRFFDLQSNSNDRGVWNPIASSIRNSGIQRHFDEEFEEGTNGVNLYNNAGGSNLVVSRITASADSLVPPNKTGKVMKIAYNGNGTTSPNFGGIYQTISSEENHTFVQLFQAKLPDGRYFVINENGQGTRNTSYWLTDHRGTGKWEWYARVSHCGDSGTFSSGGHISVGGGSDAAFNWYIASMTQYDVTESPYNYTSAGKGSSGQILKADGDGTYSWITNEASGAIINSGTWNGANFSGSRYKGLTINGGELSIQRDHPNNGQVSLLVDGGYSAGENNGFYSLYSGNSWNNRVGFYSDTGGFMKFNSTHSTGGYYFQNNGTTRITMTYDGQIKWGSAANFGTLTWDTGKAIITSQGSNNLEIRRVNSSDMIDLEENEIRFVADGTERMAVNQNGVDLGGSTANKIVHNAADTRDKYRVWTSSHYAIGMQSAITFGGLNDYGMTFQMNSESDRGFWFGDSSHGKAAGAMALTTEGKLTVAHSMRIGYGESDTTTPGASYKLDVSGNTHVDGNLWITSKIHTFSSGTGHVASMENNGTYLMMRNPEGNTCIFMGDSGDSRNVYDNGSHVFRALGGGSTYATLNSTGIEHTSSSAFTMGNIANKIRIQTDGVDDFSFLTTGNAYANILTNAITTSYGVTFTNGNTNFLQYNNATENVLYMRDITNGAMLQTWGVNDVTMNKPLKVASGTAESALRIDANAARGANRYALDIVDDDTNGRGSVRVTNASGTGMKITTQNNNWNMELVSADGGGSPAMSMGVRMQSFEGRANGHYHFDEDYSGQWFSGLRYAGATTNWQVGYRDGSSGNSPDYLSRARIMVDNNGNLHADADVIAYSSTIGSDIKLKKNVKDINYGLKDVLDIRAVEFDWKEKRDGKHDIGFIAQEIEKIIPEVVNEVTTIGEGAEDGDTHKVVDYAKLTSVLIKAVQEQQQQINELKEKLNG